MTAAGEVWITDFGMSRFIPPNVLMPDDAYSGTTVYAAPELLLDNLTKTFMTHNYFASDAWAVGASLYEIVVGKRPFQGDDNNEIVHHMFTIKGTPTARDGVVFGLFEKYKYRETYPESFGGLRGRIRGRAKFLPDKESPQW